MCVWVYVCACVCGGGCIRVQVCVYRCMLVMLMQWYIMHVAAARPEVCL